MFEGDNEGQLKIKSIICMLLRKLNAGLSASEQSWYVDWDGVRGRLTGQLPRWRVGVAQRRFLRILISITSAVNN